MLFHTRLTKLLLLLVVAGLTTVTGCQQRSVSDRPDPEGVMTQQVTVAVSGMSWPKGWPPRVREALASLPWVKQVQVNFDKKQATFLADPDKYDEKAITQVLEQAGFGGKVVK